MKRKHILSIGVSLVVLLLLTSCATSSKAQQQDIEMLVQEAFTAPHSYMTENWENFEYLPLTLGEGFPEKETAEANAQIEQATEEYLASLTGITELCSENGLNSFYADLANMQIWAAKMGGSVEVQSVEIEEISETGRTTRFKVLLLINDNTELEVAGKAQFGEDGKIAYVDVKEAMDEILNIWVEEAE